MRTRQERKSHQRRNRIITVDRVNSLFNDDCIRSLATADKLPTATDLNVLGAGLRDAAWFFALEVRIPNANELYEEIAALLSLEVRKKFGLLAIACENLSPEAEAQLTCLGTLPSPDAIRNPERQEAAREAIVALCHYGQKVRRRPPPCGREAVTFNKAIPLRPCTQSQFREARPGAEFCGAP